MATANPNATAALIAQAVQGSGDPTGSNYAAFHSEAQALIGAYGGAGSRSTSSPSTSTDQPYEFEIAKGTNYWDGIVSLAQAVNWLLWYEGDTLFYMTATDLIKSKPIATIDVITGTMISNLTIKDGERVWSKLNTTYDGAVSVFSFDTDSTNTTTECTLDLVCEPSFVKAGDILHLTDPSGKAPWSTGPYDGRWVVTDSTRSILNDYTAVTIDIPGTTNLPAPLDEPPNTTTTSTSSGSPSTTPVSVSGSSSVPGHPELTADVSKLVNTILQKWSKLQITSTVRPGENPNTCSHTAGRAADLSCGDQSYMDQAGAWVAANFTSDICQGIHNPVSGRILSVNAGKSVAASFWGSTTWAQHRNHLHIAV